MELQHRLSPTRVVMRAAVGTVNATGRPSLAWGAPFLADIQWSPKQGRLPPMPYVRSIIHGEGPAFDMGGFDPHWDLYSREHEGRYFAMQVVAEARADLSPTDAIAHAMAAPDPSTKMDFQALSAANDAKRRAEMTAMTERAESIFRGL